MQMRTVARGALTVPFETLVTAGLAYWLALPFEWAALLVISVTICDAAHTIGRAIRGDA